MKKLLFTLLALVCSVSMWADAVTPVYKDFNGLGTNVVYVDSHQNITQTNTISIIASTAASEKWLTGYDNESWVGENISERTLGINPDTDESMSGKLKGGRMKGATDTNKQRHYWFYVTGVTAVWLYHEANSSRNSTVNVFQENVATAVFSSTTNTKTIKVTELDPSKKYIVKVNGDGSDVYFYAAKFFGTASTKDASTFALTSSNNLFLNINGQATITTENNAGAISFKSNNTSIATVDNNGKITAVGGGTTSISVEDAGSSTVQGKTLSVTVNTLYAEDKTSESFKFDNAGYFLTNDGKWYFKNGWSISTNQGYQYAALECNGKNNNGFKVTAGKTYTINVPEGVTIRSAKVTMRSNYGSDQAAANWGTIFGQDLSLIALPYSNEEAVTKTFKITEDTPMTFTPGGNQCQMYVELLTTEFVPAEPKDPQTIGSIITETVTINQDGTANSDLGKSCVTTSGNTSDNQFDGKAYGLKFESSRGKVTISIPSDAVNSSVELLSSSTFTSLKINGTATSCSPTEVILSDGTTKKYTLSLPIADELAGTDYTIEKGSGSPVIYQIIFKYEKSTGVATGLSLTTTANMAGHRSFYDAEKSYKADANTTVYVAKEQDAEGNIVLSSLNKDVPAGTPVILIASNAAKQSDRTYKITLTEANNVDEYKGDNLLKATTAGQNIDAYRLGYKDKAEGGIGFYKYTSASAPAGIVYLEASSASSKMSFVFAEETTGINKVATVSEGTQARKAIVNGRLMIVTANGMYTPAGALVK